MRKALKSWRDLAKIPSGIAAKKAVTDLSQRARSAALVRKFEPSLNKQAATFGETYCRFRGMNSHSSDRDTRLRRIRALQQKRHRAAATGDEPIALAVGTLDSEVIDQSSETVLWDPDELAGG